MFIISKIKYFVKKHKIGLGVALLLPLYHFVVVNHAQFFGVSDLTYPYFTVDYSMGFCDKFFIGELYRLVSGKYTPEAASAFVSVFYALFIFLIAYLLDKFTLAFKQNTKACVVLICFALVGPFSFNIFIKQFGMLDFFWAFFFFAAIVFLNNKYLKFFVPVLAVLMIFVHYGAMICYVAALLLVIVFYALKSESKKERISFILIFSLTLVLSVGFTLYFLRNDTGNLVYSVEQFRHIVQEERGAYSGYYDIEFYKELPSSAYKSDLYKAAYEQGFMGGNANEYTGLFQALITQIKTTFILSSLEKTIVCIIASIIPWFVLLYVLKGYFKKASAPKKVLSVLFVGLCIVIELIGVFFSTDTPRWASHAVLLLFTFAFLVLYFDDRNGLERVENLFRKPGYVFVYVLLFFYSNIAPDPYAFIFF